MLISEQYRSLLEHEHATTQWGTVGWRHGSRVRTLIQESQIRTLLDYGAGRGSLGHWFDQNDPACVERREYEPGIPRLSKLPGPAELVTCIDVMEHVEPNCVDNVLDHIQGLTQKCVYFNISTRPAARILQDGRNAHLCLMTADEWMSKLDSRWRCVRRDLESASFTWIGAKY